MTQNNPAADDQVNNDNKTPADYDEYGYEPQQDDEPPKPDDAFTDPA
jgi:hypothetical protein